MLRGCGKTAFLFFACPALAALIVAAGCRDGSAHLPTVRLVEDIFTEAPFAKCHASTIVETPSGFVAAWFGGSTEGNPDVGIWLSRRAEDKWSPPVEVARGADPGGRPEPCWNPVLFRPSEGPLLLFYKVGPSPAQWRGMMMCSPDDGRTWETPRLLPDGIIGPVKNHPIELDAGIILCGSSTEDDGWRVHFETTPDLGRTWLRTAPINAGREPRLIQPALLRDGAGVIIALMRSDAGRIYESRSADRGATWNAPKPTVLPNPNSGLDAATLRDGRHVLAYNPLTEGRGVLAVAMSVDGLLWKQVLTLEDEPGAEFSYPAVIQTRDGSVHITYTWKRRRIRCVVVDLRTPY
ncbi:MAG TPA: sialidase [Candidatus Aminicenantes bacterium]|nr:sialidase [Candidatus Aminicenantes bacterium]